MSKVVAICQSNYIPWKGYFDMISMADVFVLYDDMQYTRRDWRNRNKIKSNSGVQWLSIPVDVKGKYHQKINETKVSDLQWSEKHWDRVKYVYGKSEYFSDYESRFEDMYMNKLQGLSYLSDINKIIIKTICKILDIHTKIISSSEFELAEDRTKRLLSICQELGAEAYLSGPAAKEYIDINLFKDAGVEVKWMDYSKYPVYEQMHDVFEHGVSVLDLIFNCGPASKQFMKSVI